MIDTGTSMRAVRRALPSLLLASAALPGLVGEAQAGGFGLREQSSYYQGMSFAGNAAGGAGLASMYWNPAAVSFVPGMQVEGNISYIAPHASIDIVSARGPLGTNLGPLGVGNIVDNGAIPTGYATYAWDRVAVGLSLNAPFGLVTDAPCNWAGRYYGCYNRIFDLNVGAQVAFKVTDWLTLGAGVNANYIDARLTNAQMLGGPPTYPQGSAAVNGSDMGYGFSLGALFTLMPGTTLGVGYRSFIDQTLDGLTTLDNAAGITVATLATNADLTLPDQITASLRSQIDPRWTLLGTVEWTNWSTVQQLVIQPVKSTPSVLNLQWNDGWFFSGGVEYQWDPQLTLRAGIAYEISPINDEHRSPRLPDSDRFWVSAGLTYAWTPHLSLDLAYTHIFGQDGNITLSPADPANATRGSLAATVSDAYVDIISVGVRYRFDAPIQKTVLVTK
ncbi:OmpP1/FadL family transporter [Aquabacter spiritensis]|uniref:Long-chain fatty acid transport protein n=1 Tax=Aquabacter spiritensis TaxID=933073 RepID=A0A4R3LSH2_9HYPH|nr:outer membrane protein transport protein [Aquabacter spiritensis]TCT03472.1 long-chain fatty acid transport protein [Aquabacter spiritensis]